MRTVKILLLQIGIFILTAKLFDYTFFPFDSWFQSPNWAVTLAYGSLFALPLFFARKDWHLLACVAGCALVWVASVSLKVKDPSFIGHIGPLYMASTAVCVVAQVSLVAHGEDRWNLKIILIGSISFLMSLWGLLLVELYNVRLGQSEQMTTWSIIVQNLLFFAQTVVACSGIKDGPKITGESNADQEVYEEEFRKAA